MANDLKALATFLRGLLAAGTPGQSSHPKPKPNEYVGAQKNPHVHNNGDYTAGGGPGNTWGDVGDVVGAILNPLGTLIETLASPQVRNLKIDEIALAWGSGSVFESSLPSTGSVFLTDMSGMGNRQFTVPGPFLTALIIATLSNPVTAGIATRLGLLVQEHPEVLTNYLIFAGDGYGNMANFSTGGRPGHVLIHELTHVWQGVHQSFPYDYVLDSVVSQLIKHDAYAYTPGSPWTSYGAEQQAHLVEDWFIRGSKTTNIRFFYIANNIRLGNAIFNETPSGGSDF